MWWKDINLSYIYLSIPADTNPFKAHMVQKIVNKLKLNILENTNI